MQHLLLDPLPDAFYLLGMNCPTAANYLTGEYCESSKLSFAKISIVLTFDKYQFDDRRMRPTIGTEIPKQKEAGR
jgi:hypothetical protein